MHFIQQNSAILAQEPSCELKRNRNLALSEQFNYPSLVGVMGEGSDIFF